jgi:hypothetical protein
MGAARPFSPGRLAWAVALCLAPAIGARADVIDGEWCHADGRQMSIKGPNIVTPAGAHLAGDYTRHSFTYVVPASEANAGQIVAMILVNEETVNLRIGADASLAAQAPVQVWHRCPEKTSGLRVATPPS